MKEHITTISFFKYKGFRQQAWAFRMMNDAHAYIARTDGVFFYKLMGCGRNEGFNPFPDWSAYALLLVWNDEAAAETFFETSELMQLYSKNTVEHWTIYMKNISAKGEWSAQNPFQKSTTLNPDNQLIAVITRATIKVRKLYRFWKYVPTSHLSLKGNEGLIYTNGIGEVPVIQMATFSLWRDRESLMNFAYKSQEHRTAIEKTRQLDWYKEELFSRFQPYRSLGTWGGVNPLDKYLK